MPLYLAHFFKRKGNGHCHVFQCSRASSIVPSSFLLLCCHVYVNQTQMCHFALTFRHCISCLCLSCLPYNMCNLVPLSSTLSLSPSIHTERYSLQLCSFTPFSFFIVACLLVFVRLKLYVFQPWAVSYDDYRFISSSVQLITVKFLYSNSLHTCCIKLVYSFSACLIIVFGEIIPV